MKNNQTSQSTLIAQKSLAKKAVIKKYSLPLATKYIACIDLSDTATRNFIVEGLSQLGVSVFVIGKTSVKDDFTRIVDNLSDDILEWCDFLVSDTKTNPRRITTCILAGIVPIVPNNTPFKTMFSQFDPMQFTGNSYIYDGGKYQIFASTVALLENMKFPADHEILLKNITKTL